MSNLKKLVLIALCLFFTLRPLGGMTAVLGAPFGQGSAGSVSDDFSTNDISNYTVLSGSNRKLSLKLTPRSPGRDGE